MCVCVDVVVGLKGGLTFSSCCQAEEKGTSFHTESSQRKFSQGKSQKLEETHMLKVLFI